MMHFLRLPLFVVLMSLLAVTVTHSVQAQIITGFTLIQTPSTSLGPVPSTINLRTVGTSLNIRADIASNVNVAIDKVVFSFDGARVRTESMAPYALGGDLGGSYYSMSRLTTLGVHTVIAEAFNSNNNVIDTHTIQFTVVNRATTPTTPVAVPAPIPLPTPIRVPSPMQAAPIGATSPTPNGAKILGELRKWHKVTLAFTGPTASETSTTVNPFMDYRLDVTFVHQTTQKSYVVPGYFAADGNAAETSATSGNQWLCHFSPDEIGNWDYTASFVTGTNIAVSTNAGTSISFHGQKGSISIQATNKTGRDHRGKGRLKYVGQHHLQFAETGEWFLKAGADSPENFLAYADFDNTPNNGNGRKTWNPHVRDFVAGDPTWKTDKGKGIIGAINYLSKQGMNVFSFLTMNINGDDKNVYPYVSSTDFFRMDVSKLAQWEIVFEHADKMGMFLHMKTSEQENDQLLDGGNLGNARKLYYRELIARFGHHLALNWNLSEEITNTIPQIKSFSDYFKQIDPYKNLVVTHTWPNSDLYKDLLGHGTFDGASLQTSPSRVFNNTLHWVKESAEAGHKWIVTNDEQGSANTGVVPDTNDPNHDNIRQQVLWGNIMAGGAGVEYYFGYSYSNSDLTCQDLSSRRNMWTQSFYALHFFFNNNVPFWQMSNNANRITSTTDWLLSSSDGTVHVVYRRSTTAASVGIKLDGLSGTYSVKWYNPRAGGSLQNGSITSIQAGRATSVSYGNPPTSDGKDWVILIRKI